MNIREIRKALGLSQEKFGELFGVDHTTVSSWELGKAIPREQRLKKIRSLLEKLPEDKRKKALVDKPNKERVLVKAQNVIKPYVPRKRAKLYVDDSFLYRRKENVWHKDGC